MKRILYAVIATVFCAMPGCTPRVRVTPHPGPHEQGIRYYRPKPYLLITAAAKEVETDNGKTITRTPGEQFVNIQLQYLPDFEEEYAIDVRTGLGTADVEIKLENGWNLTGLNQDLDSKTSENIEAAASLMSAIAKTGAKSMVDGGGQNNPPSSKSRRATYRWVTTNPFLAKTVADERDFMAFAMWASCLIKHAQPS